MKNNEQNIERRGVARKTLNAPIKTKFRMEVDAEITDISTEGVAIRFSPVEQNHLANGAKLLLHLEMNGRLVSLEGTVKQLHSKDGSVTIGLEYDRDQLSVFSAG